MAHTFIYAKINQTTERIVVAPSVLVYLFMYFFCEVAKEDTELQGLKAEIYNHYQAELLQYRSSASDAMLEEVAATPLIRLWYLSLLSKVEERFRSFGEYVHNDYLNEIRVLSIAFRPHGIVFEHPIPVASFIDLVNDVRWVLNELNQPSESYKWFVDEHNK